MTAMTAFQGNLSRIPPGCDRKTSQISSPDGVNDLLLPALKTSPSEALPLIPAYLNPGLKRPSGIVSILICYVCIPLTWAPGTAAIPFAVTWSTRIVVLMNSQSSTVQFLSTTIPERATLSGSAMTSPLSRKLLRI